MKVRVWRVLFHKDKIRLRNHLPVRHFSMALGTDSLEMIPSWIPHWVPQSGNGVCLIGRVKQVFPAKSGRMTSCLVFPTQYQLSQRQPPGSLSGAKRGRTDRCPLALCHRLKRPQGSHEEGRCIGAAGKGLKSHPNFDTPLSGKVKTKINSAKTISDYFYPIISKKNGF